MDYNTLFKHITSLSPEHQLLGHLKPVALTYQQHQSFANASEILSAITQLGDVTGWITWPDGVERIESQKSLTADIAMPPLEGELVTSTHHQQDQKYIRLHYRNQRWNLITITLQEQPNPSAANALAEQIQLASREKAQANLCYTRIWQMDEDQGVVSTDAIFTGFAGGEQ
ncbi:hypothetical protein [Marinomonas spartinae]|uniref:hypothetical protein n=1 Tax=Marinomonas spartinae TaxID=1792290 RepID=UPI0018F1E802|nr:hypothetical protein [Marinomonas spartinae]MBJ7556670.1 hypothetical protein [Marinomonas spartinae]